LRRLYRGALALVFPANEDFGIVPVEAQACGTPVVAVDQGGSRDTVSSGESGVLVPTADPAELAAGVERAVATILPEACRSWALRFSPDRFRRELLAWVDDAAPLERRS
jgi:glycosyltransferase involved in cell wall biosynthesis